VDLPGVETPGGVPVIPARKASRSDAGRAFGIGLFGWSKTTEKHLSTKQITCISHC
jgi:hypothetical protein